MPATFRAGWRAALARLGLRFADDAAEDAFLLFSHRQAQWGRVLLACNMIAQLPRYAVAARDLSDPAQRAMLIGTGVVLVLLLIGTIATIDALHNRRRSRLLCCVPRLSLRARAVASELCGCVFTLATVFLDRAAHVSARISFDVAPPAGQPEPAARYAINATTATTTVVPAVIGATAAPTAVVVDVPFLFFFPLTFTLAFAPPRRVTLVPFVAVYTAMALIALALHKVDGASGPWTSFDSWGCALLAWDAVIAWALIGHWERTRRADFLRTVEIARRAMHVRSLVAVIRRSLTAPTEERDAGSNADGRQRQQQQPRPKRDLDRVHAAVAVFRVNASRGGGGSDRGTSADGRAFSSGSATDAALDAQRAMTTEVTALLESVNDAAAAMDPADAPVRAVGGTGGTIVVVFRLAEGGDGETATAVRVCAFARAVMRAWTARVDSSAVLEAATDAASSAATRTFDQADAMVDREQAAGLLADRNAPPPLPPPETTRRAPVQHVVGRAPASPLGDSGSSKEGLATSGSSSTARGVLGVGVDVGVAFVGDAAFASSKHSRSAAVLPSVVAGPAVEAAERLSELSVDGAIYASAPCRTLVYGAYVCTRISGIRIAPGRRGVHMVGMPWAPAAQELERAFRRDFRQRRPSLHASAAAGSQRGPNPSEAFTSLVPDGIRSTTELPTNPRPQRRTRFADGPATEMSPTNTDGAPAAPHSSSRESSGASRPLGILRKGSVSTAASASRSQVTEEASASVLIPTSDPNQTPATRQSPPQQEAQPTGGHDAAPFDAAEATAMDERPVLRFGLLTGFRFVDDDVEDDFRASENSDSGRVIPAVFFIGSVLVLLFAALLPHEFSRYSAGLGGQPALAWCAFGLALLLAVFAAALVRRAPLGQVRLAIATLAGVGALATGAVAVHLLDDPANPMKVFNGWFLAMAFVTHVQWLPSVMPFWLPPCVFMAMVIVVLRRQYDISLSEFAIESRSSAWLSLIAIVVTIVGVRLRNRSLYASAAEARGSLQRWLSQRRELRERLCLLMPRPVADAACDGKGLGLASAMAERSAVAAAMAGTHGDAADAADAEDDWFSAPTVQWATFVVPRGVEGASDATPPPRFRLFAARAVVLVLQLAPAVGLDEGDDRAGAAAGATPDDELSVASPGSAVLQLPHHVGGVTSLGGEGGAFALDTATPEWSLRDSTTHVEAPAVVSSPQHSSDRERSTADAQRSPQHNSVDTLTRSSASDERRHGAPGRQHASSSSPRDPAPSERHAVTVGLLRVASALVSATALQPFEPHVSQVGSRLIVVMNVRRRATRGGGNSSSNARSGDPVLAAEQAHLAALSVAEALPELPGVAAAVRVRCGVACGPVTGTYHGAGAFAGYVFNGPTIIEALAQLDS